MSRRALIAPRKSVPVRIGDAGPAAATDVYTNLWLPAGLTLVSAPGATIDAGTLAWVDASIAPGSDVTHDVTVEVGLGVHGLVAIGGVATSFEAQDPDPANDVSIGIVRLG